MSTTSIDLLTGGLLQGTLDGNGGFLPNSTRVIMTNRIALPNYLGRKYTVSAVTSTGKTINTDFVGYADSITQMFVYDSDWQSNPKTYDLSSQSSVNYFRIVLKYSDNSTILPEEITSLTLSDTAVWHAAEGEYPINDLTPPVLQTNFRRPYPSSLWRIDENNGGYPYTDYHLGIIFVAQKPSEGPSPALPPSRDPIHITVDNMKRGDAGNSYNNGKWVIPWYNIDNQTYIQVRGQDSIIPVLNSNDESQYTRYPIDNSVIFNLQRGGED